MNPANPHSLFVQVQRTDAPTPELLTQQTLTYRVLAIKGDWMAMQWLQGEIAYFQRSTGFSLSGAWHIVSDTAGLPVKYSAFDATSTYAQNLQERLQGLQEGQHDT